MLTIGAIIAVVVGVVLTLGDASILRTVASLAFGLYAQAPHKVRDKIQDWAPGSCPGPAGRGTHTGGSPPGSSPHPLFP